MLSGIIEEFGVHNTVQLAELMSATGRLFLKTSEGEFSLFYEQGVIVHAEAGTLRGDDAVVFVLRKATSGSFELDQTAIPPERTVTKAIQLLVLLAAKAQDEESVEAAAPKRTDVGEILERIVADLHLRFASYVAEGSPPTIRMNPESTEPIDLPLLCSMSDTYLSKVEVERMLGTTKSYQFAIGRADQGWLFLGGDVSVPLAMLGALLRKAVTQLEADLRQKDSVPQ